MIPCADNYDCGASLCFEGIFKIILFVVFWEAPFHNTIKLSTPPTKLKGIELALTSELVENLKWSVVKKLHSLA